MSRLLSESKPVVAAVIGFCLVGTSSIETGYGAEPHRERRRRLSISRRSWHPL